MSSPVKFEIRGYAEPQLLSRIIGLIAQLGLVPSRFHAHADGEMMTVEVEQSDLCDDKARIIAEKLRSFVLIEHVKPSRGGVCLDVPARNVLNEFQS